jgi:hypothetical protein
MKHIIFIGLVLLISACADAPIATRTVMQDRPQIVLSDPRPVNQRPVEWTIITNQNLNENLERFRRSDRFTLFSITAEGYENLSVNVAELRRYIQQQRELIRSLREYYESPSQENNRPRTSN